MEMLPRVMFDTNDGTETVGYWLGFDQSKRDLSAIGANLADGLHVIIYMPGELEMEAILSFDRSQDVWLAHPVAGTIKYLDEDILPPDPASPPPPFARQTAPYPAPPRPSAA